MCGLGQLHLRWMSRSERFRQIDYGQFNPSKSRAYAVSFKSGGLKSSLQVVQLFGNWSCTNLQVSFNISAFIFLFREVGQQVIARNLKPSVANSMMIRRIQEEFPDNNGEAMVAGPSRSTRTNTFGKQRKQAQVKDFDPLEPPEELFVGF